MRLGSIEFKDYEVPTKINFGGRQVLASHRLAGGRRVIDLLGPDSDDITFSGTFSGHGALVRANAVDSLRRRGITTVLLWDNISYDVVVSAFSASFMNQTWIPYKCACSVIHKAPNRIGRETLSGSSSRLSPSMLSTVGTLIQTLPELAGLSASHETVSGSESSLSAILQAQASVVVALAAAAQRLTTNLDVNCVSAETAIATLANLEAGTHSLSMLIAARSYLGAAASGTGVP